MPWHRVGINAVIPPLTWQVRPQVDAVVRSVGPDAVVVDLAAGGRKISPNVITVDLLLLRNTSIVANIENIPIGDKSVDLVVATGILEHVGNEEQFLCEVFRILKPGGLVHIEVPFLQQYHADPIDCRRFTLPGLGLLIQKFGFNVINDGVHIGPTVTMITLAAYYLALWFEGNSVFHRIASNGVFFLASSIFFPFKFLDAYLIRKKNAHRVAFGVFCTARKPISVGDRRFSRHDRELNPRDGLV